MIKKLLFATALLGLVAASSFGQGSLSVRPKIVSPEFYLNREDVRTSLHLSEAQLDDLKQIKMSYQQMATAPVAGNRGQKLRRLSKQAQMAEWKVLEPDQQKRLREIWLQFGGLALVPHSADLQTDLALTDDQKKQMETLSHQSEAADAAAMNRGFKANDKGVQLKKDLVQNHEEYVQRLQEILTEEQGLKFKTLQGKPFAGTISN